ncbi:hypothetical protein A0H81_06758 [Grifola frondosa]|uniref:Uncharacterized protein n=1 Tax=Grifola frondosa TaxID=5627 RepID=A0A1C7M7M7_GRIFR|nr:hypothetical protein A0H81_06758 [Grifola frondosa]
MAFIGLPLLPQGVTEDNRAIEFARPRTRSSDDRDAAPMDCISDCARERADSERDVAELVREHWLEMLVDWEQRRAAQRCHAARLLPTTPPPQAAIGPNVKVVSATRLSVRVRALRRPGNATGVGDPEEDPAGTVPALALRCTCGCLGGIGMGLPLKFDDSGLGATKLPFDIGEPVDSRLPVDCVDLEWCVECD